MLKALSTLLALVCGLTLLAACCLGLSSVAFNGATSLRALGTLALFMVPSAFTLLIMMLDLSATGLGLVAGLGGAGVIWLGWSVISRMLASPHFEGYAILMGVLGIAQGALTLVWLTASRVPPQTSSAS